MVDLSTKFGGLEFKNPVWIAALGSMGPWMSREGAADVYMKLVRRYYDMGAGAFFTAGIWFEEPTFEWRGKLRMAWHGVRGYSDTEGSVGCAIVPDNVFPRSIGMESIKRIKTECPEMRIIANILGPGIDPDGWAGLAAEVQQAGADMVELNLATFMTFESMEQALGGIETREKFPPAAGIMAGLIPEAGVQIIQAIGKKCSVPVLVKITPEMGAFRLIPAAYMYKASGAVGLTCSHNFFTFAPPDIYSGGLPAIPFMDKVASVATQGSWHRFACYRDVGSVVKYCPGFDVSACGGLVIPEQCIEAMMLGARSVQLSSGLMSNGISFISQVLAFMTKYVEEQGFKKVDDFIGMAQKHVVEYMEMVEWWHAHPVVAKIDYIKCLKCGKCLDNWCWATEWENGKPKVDPKICSGCSICVMRCPNGARSLVPVKVNGKMPEFMPRAAPR